MKSIAALFLPKLLPKIKKEPRSTPDVKIELKSSPAKKKKKKKKKKPATLLPKPTLPLNRAEIHFTSLIHSARTNLQVRQIHAQILLRDLSFSSYLTTQLISSSSLRYSIEYSISIFDQYTCDNNLFTFNALIRGLVKNSCYLDSILRFKLMLRSGVKPDRLTYPFVLKSIAGLCLEKLGGSLHCMVMKCGEEFDTFVRISLLDMYVKMQESRLALKVFDESPQRFESESTLLWNVVINGCCKAGDMKTAVRLFEAMPESNIDSWNSLIDGFFKRGDVKRATKLFDSMPEKNVVSWTITVNGLSLCGYHEKALTTFSRMLENGMRPNDFTIVSALSACAKIGALDSGLRIHNYIRDNGFLVNGAIGNALVDMYAKCGNVESAGQVFSQMKHKDILTWSAMIWGWTLNGHFEQAIQCFRQMMYAGVKPDEVAFLALLTACTHSGQVELGRNFFDSMTLDYSIEPSMKHCVLIVDLLGRAGRLEHALSFIEGMPIDPDFTVWVALFCACRVHRNIRMAELASQKILELEPKRPGNYAFLLNVYTAIGRLEDAERVGISMQKRQIEKDLGWSYIEVDGQVHSFVCGDLTHRDTKEIYLKLEEIMSGALQQGYKQATALVPYHIEEEGNEDVVGTHSEKLALAFALIHTSPGMTVRIVKKLRVCGDCHSFMKYASKMSQRVIILRDRSRFHQFKDGTCSCRDYW